MKFFLDTEFREGVSYGTFLGFKVGKPINTIDLISIGIVCQNGEEFFALNSEHDLKTTWQDDWLRENVLKPIYNKYVQGFQRDIDRFNLSTMQWLFKMYGKTRGQIAHSVQHWLNSCLYVDFYANERLNNPNKPEFWAYYADYDWVVFAQLFGRMINLPENFPMYCRDLKQKMDEVAENSVSKVLSLEGRLKFIKESKDYPKEENLHDALDDAKWNRKLFYFLEACKI